MAEWQNGRMAGMAEWQNGRMAGMAGMAVEWQRLATYILFTVHTDTDNDDTDDDTLIFYSIEGCESALQLVGEMDYNYRSRHKDWRWIKENIPNSYRIMA